MRVRFAVLVARLVALVAFVALLTAGCAFDSTPQLIQVLDYAPHEAEVGDRIELTGQGFPQGRPAHLTFRGTLHRPGERPVTGAEINAEGTASGPTKIELTFSDALLSLFCGAGDRALHTTFEGEVLVAFSVASPKDPPIEGTLRKVSLDVRPPALRADAARARAAEGERALSFLGIHPKEDDAPLSGGVVIAGVDAGSRAEDAGLAPGDVIVRFDGVRVAEIADVVPAPGEKTASLGVRRGEDPRERTRAVSVEGYRPAAPTELLAAAVILAAAAVVVLLFFGPSLGAFGWIERRVAARVQEATGARRSKGWLVAFMAFARDFTESLSIVRAAPYVVFVAATAMFLALPFGQYLAGAQADCGVLFLLSFTAFVLIAVVTGGFAAGSGYTLGRAARAARDAVSADLPAAIAVLSVVVATGTLRVQEIIRAQGGLPWDWYALKSPVTLALFFLYFSTALVDEERDPKDLVEADLGRARASRPRSTRAAFFFFTEQARTFVLAGLAAALFLGGWQLPFVAPAQQESSRVLELFGAALFACKSWGLALLVAWVRWALPRVPAGRMTRIVWTYLVPASAACLVLSLGWTTFGPGPGAQRMTSVAIAAAGCLAIVYAVRRVRYSVRAARVALNPFL